MSAHGHPVKQIIATKILKYSLKPEAGLGPGKNRKHIHTHITTTPYMHVAISPNFHSLER